MPSEKMTKNGKVRPVCPDCGKDFKNAGALKGHGPFCMGPDGKRRRAARSKPAAEDPPRAPRTTSTEEPPPRPSKPRAEGWGPLADL